MKWRRFIVAAGAVCLLGFLIWALLPEPKESESLSLTSSETVKEESVPVALISGSEPTDVPWTSRSPAARRVRRIFPDLSWMTAAPVLKAGDVITLALFDDAVFEGRIRNVTVYPNGAVGMTAHLTGEEQGTIYLSYSDQKLRASVEVPGGADYAIRYQADTAAHYVIEVDRENSIILEGADALVSALKDGLSDAPASAAIADPGAQADTPAGATVIDVMVVYTPAAAAWAANDPDEEGIESVIAIAMERANEAHTNSNTQIVLRLVHSAEVNYTESAAYQGYKTDLILLRGTNDGEMDEIHDLRNQYGADFVCLFEINDEVGGYGQLLQSQSGNPSRAFCLVRVEQSSWTYTVVHEWGHNMGCHHSANQTDSPGPTGWFDWPQNHWSAGWQWDDTEAASTNPSSSYYGVEGYCSVMTYQNHHGDSDYEYRRMAYFSNPDITYIGNSTNVTGDVSAGDNARTIRELKSVFADYRDAVQVVVDDDIDDDGIPNDWEQLYFGGETNAIPSALAANGVNTILETYIAGINPTNPASLFRAAFTNENGFVIRWNVTSGRVYSVFGSTNLSDSFQPLETNILWPQSSWTDTVNQSECFYQVDVKLAE